MFNVDTVNINSVNNKEFDNRLHHRSGQLTFQSQRNVKDSRSDMDTEVRPLPRLWVSYG